MTVSGNPSIDFSGLSDDRIALILQEYNIPLTPDEARRVQHDMLKRPPTLTELVLFSIEGSEHCSYKSSRPHLKQFITDGPHVVLGAKEDAGVVAVATDHQDRRWCIVLSHESHNHPSQIVPYEGAATGVGGNVRDVLCMGAEVIAVSDSLRFGDIQAPRTLWIHEGVVEGIAGYGNPLGIPNIGGDLYYDSGYNDNCLVTVVTLGIVREDRIIHSYAPEGADGFDLILVGKPTDNSGFGGASFASLELEEEKKEQNKGAVQEPNAFLERHLVKATGELFRYLQEHNLCDDVGFKDLGAGGIACASVELADAAGMGATVQLENVHRSLDRLHPSVLLCAETQERFMWVMPPGLTGMALTHYNSVFDLPGVSNLATARVIGQITEKSQYRVLDGNRTLVDAPAPEITRGFLYHRPVETVERFFPEPEISADIDLNQTLLRLLAHENIASRKAVFETYDKQVQGRTVIESGVADAGVMAPFNSPEYPEEIRAVGIALSTDHNPRFGKIDPYWCAVNAVAEAIRNVAAVGARPQAVSDCLCFGNPEKPEQMGDFAAAARGVADACKAFRLPDHENTPLPIIAGNVSFYNESRGKAIPASPIISCLGAMENVARAVTSVFKAPDSVLCLVGERKNECGGSVFYSLFNALGMKLPRPDMEELNRQVQALNGSIQAGLVRACHDISEGGLAVALAEMCFPNDIGCAVTIPGGLPEPVLLFSETGGFILELDAGDVAAVRREFANQGVQLMEIGMTTDRNMLAINDVIRLPVAEARKTWQEGLRNKL
ncbi:MAG: phosphoribosylformylglycinamidine synthase subunit PurL [Fidelibacterota bacterium]